MLVIVFCLIDCSFYIDVPSIANSIPFRKDQHNYKKTAENLQIYIIFSSKLTYPTINKIVVTASRFQASTNVFFQQLEKVSGNFFTKALLKQSFIARGLGTLQ